MSDHRFVTDVPEFVTPRLVVMLTGWIDASGAAAAAMSALEVECDARPFVQFDDDVYIDYRARRPILEVRSGVSTRLVWSSPELLLGRDAEGRDVLLLSGPEPDMAWHRFTNTVVSLAERFGVQSMTTLGAYPFAMPHTRPPVVSSTSPSRDLIAQLGFRANSVDVPAGAVAALEQAMHEHDIPAVGLWAQVPHYVAAMSYPAASVALLDALNWSQGSPSRLESSDARWSSNASASTNSSRATTSIGRWSAGSSASTTTMSPTQRTTARASSCAPGTSWQQRSSASSGTRRVRRHRLQSTT